MAESLHPIGSITKIHKIMLNTARANEYFVDIQGRYTLNNLSDFSSIHQSAAIDDVLMLSINIYTRVNPCCISYK